MGFDIRIKSWHLLQSFAVLIADSCPGELCGNVV